MAMASAITHHPAKSLALGFHFCIIQPETSIPITDTKVFGMPPLAPDEEADILKGEERMVYFYA